MFVHYKQVLYFPGIQECIPVGCVPSAAVAVSGGDGLPWAVSTQVVGIYQTPPSTPSTESQTGVKNITGR